MTTPGEQPQEITPFRMSTDGLSDNFCDILAQEHGLSIVGGEFIGELEAQRHPLATVDISFAQQNPTIPAENVTSRLDNYDPQNASQADMLGKARQLVQYHGLTRLAGLIVCGQAGIGKTHIAVGVAKESMLREGTPSYVNIPTIKQSGKKEAEALSARADIVIIDDLNQQFGVGSEFFRHLLTNMHNKGGGKLLVTTNYGSPEQFVADMTEGAMVSKVDSTRIRDRIAGALLGLIVEGESYRRVKQQDQAPWWLQDEAATDKQS